MRIADVLPLTPLQQGLLFHASTAQGSDDDVYAVQLDIALSGPLDQQRLHDAVQVVVCRHPHLVARFSDKFDEPVQIVPADPEVPWQYIELDADEPMSMSMGRSSGSVPKSAPQSATSPASRPFGWR